MDLATQFHSPALYEHPKYISDCLDDAQHLVDKKPFDKPSLKDIERLNMWVMGPRKGHAGGVYVWGCPISSVGSVQSLVTSISRIEGCSDLLVYTDSFQWFLLTHMNAASSIAKSLDILLRGGYTDIPMMHVDNWRELESTYWKLPEGMDIPENRRELGLKSNVRWLVEYLGRRNSNHPKYQEVMEVLKGRLTNS